MEGTAIEEWVLGSADLGSHPVLLGTCCVTLSELLPLSGPLLRNSPNITRLKGTFVKNQ